jgi:hypothetical protein
MPLNQHLVELNPKRLIACRGCHVIADISINDHVDLICPGCRQELGSWVTTSGAVDDLAAFVAKESGT